MPLIAQLSALLGAAIHVWFFVLESLLFGRPGVAARFGLRTEEQIAAVRPMAFNQGFYNLFLAIGAIIGVVLIWAGGADSAGEIAGRALVLFTLGSMVAAALVLLTTGMKYLRPALIQGTLPLIGFVLFLFS